MSAQLAGRVCVVAGLALAVLVAQAAGLEDLPKRKPGLWETSTMAAAGKRTVTSRVCIDAATDAMLTNFALGVADQVCSKRDIRVAGSVATIDTICRIGESQQTAHSTITYMGNSAYRIEGRARYEPPFLGQSEATIAQEARWTGPCPRDMKPGDLVMGNGVKINLKDIARAKP